MPVLKLFYDESLDSTVRKNSESIVAGLEALIRDLMHAEAAKCQIILTSAFHMSPLPIYVDLQFRATEERTTTTVSVAMTEIARLLIDNLGEGIRIRAFDINQAHLHALDIPNKNNR